jgi:hypothetical protein
MTADQACARGAWLQVDADTQRCGHGSTDGEGQVAQALHEKRLQKIYD